MVLVKKLKKLKSVISNLDSIPRLIKSQVKQELYEKRTLTSKEYGLNVDDNLREREIIVSLTTYSKRIYDVYLTIESIFDQTVKADKVILWLAEDEFDNESLPMTLSNLKERGLEVKYCPDLKSYKKIIPTLKLFPNALTITVDDDILYPFDMIENLYRQHLNNKDAVVFYRAHKIELDKYNRIKPYNQWGMEKGVRDNAFLTSGGGTLFPPGCFDDEFFNEKKIFELAPAADDIWINAMLLKNNSEYIKVDDERVWSERFLIVEESQDIGLFQSNMFKNQNDVQINAVFDEYGLWSDLVNKIKGQC